MSTADCTFVDSASNKMLFKLAMISPPLVGSTFRYRAVGFDQQTLDYHSDHRELLEEVSLHGKSWLVVDVVYSVVLRSIAPGVSLDRRVTVTVLLSETTS